MMVAVGLIDATLRKSIHDETDGLAGSASLQVIPAGSTPLSLSTVGTVDATPGVQASVPLLRVLTRVHRGARSQSLLLFAVPGNLSALFTDGLGEVESQLGTPSFDGGEMVLTEQLASDLGVRRGQVVVVQTPSGARSARVGAIIAKDPFAAVNGGVFALMSLSAGQRLFERPGEVSSIYVRARSGIPIGQLRRTLHDRIGTAGTVGTPGVEGQAYERTFNSLAAIAEQARLIGLVVALFLMINTMTMAIAERRQELARLVSAGVGRNQILIAILAEAGLLGTIGAAIGVIGGALLAHMLVQRAAESYAVLPVTVSSSLAVEPSAVITGLAAGLYVSVFAAAVSGWRVLKLTPLHALRHESSYEPLERRHGRLRHARAVAGVGAICLAPLLAWQLSIGSKPAVEGLSIALVLCGTVLTLHVSIPLLTRLLTGALRPLLSPATRLGADALLRAPGRTALTAGAVAIAAGFVIAVGSSIGSFREVTDEAAGDWYRAPLYVNVEGATSYIVNQPLSASVARRLAAVEGVKALYPMSYGLINAYGRQTLVEALPVAQAAAHGDDIMASLGISRPVLVRALARGEVVISRLTARHYHLGVGSVLSLPNTGKPITVEVGGLYDDLAPFDSVLVEHSLYERITGDHSADRLAVVTKPGADTAVVKHRLQRMLDSQGIVATVISGVQMKEYLVGSIQGLFSIAKGIELAALLVAALIVLSTMVTTTTERGREFAIARAVGMSRRQIGLSVIFEGGAMAAVGSAVALALGLGLGFLITLSLQSQLGWSVAFRPAPSLLSGVLLIATALGAAAAFYPAWLISRRTIVGFLREA